MIVWIRVVVRKLSIVGIRTIKLIKSIITMCGSGAGDESEEPKSDELSPFWLTSDPDT